MPKSLVFFLNMVGSEEDRLITLKEALEASAIDYYPKYLALRIKQEEIPEHA